MDLKTRLLRWFFGQPNISGTFNAINSSMNDFTAAANVVMKALGSQTPVATRSIDSRVSSFLDVTAGAGALTQGLVTCLPGELVASIGPSTYTNVNAVPQFSTGSAKLQTKCYINWKKTGGAAYVVPDSSNIIIASGPAAWTSVGYPVAFHDVTYHGTYEAPATAPLMAWEYYDWLIDLQCKIIGYKRRYGDFRDARCARAMAAGKYSGGTVQDVLDLLHYMKQLGMIGNDLYDADVMQFVPTSWTDIGPTLGSVTVYGIQIELNVPTDFDYSYDIKAALMAATPIGLTLRIACYSNGVNFIEDPPSIHPP